MARDLRIEVGGDPSPDEVAAIMAAIEMAWPKAAVGSDAPRTMSTRWRHADRWWAQGRLPSSWG